jgi:UDP-N-acetylmuramoylalanine-D-glutamate ligase
MLALENRQSFVIGLGGRGQSACVLSKVTEATLKPPASPLVLKRVKHVLPVGGVGKRIRAAGNLFTPCALAGSLLETMAEAAKNATSDDIVLFAPACSSWNQFRNH